MNSAEKTVVVIGGGASGMMAAAAAKTAAPLSRIVVAERLPRTGKKLLATGNGRCNFTNTAISAANYHGAGDPALVEAVLSRFDQTAASRFFEALGVVPREEERGRVFPYSGNAAAVADALRFECARLGVETVCEFDVNRVERSARGFLVHAADGRELAADALVLAAGGCASPALGSNGSGFEIARSLGHVPGPLAPALVQLRAEGSDCRPLAGIKVRAEASALGNGRVFARDPGEVLFTDYGLSGPPIFQLSTCFAAGECDTVMLDLCPEMSKKALGELLRLRAQSLAKRTCEDYFVGFLNKRVGNLVFRRSGVEKLSLPVSLLDGARISRMCDTIKALGFRIDGNGGWQNAQVTAGGVDTREAWADTLMSRKCRGLFLCGELLDVYGDCGGYNLQWAWASGHAAGEGAARYVSGGAK